MDDNARRDSTGGRVRGRGPTPSQHPGMAFATGLYNALTDSCASAYKSRGTVNQGSILLFQHDDISLAPLVPFLISLGSLPLHWPAWTMDFLSASQEDRGLPSQSSMEVPRRTCNSFLLYRKEVNAQIQAVCKRSDTKASMQKDLSKQIAMMWQMESEEVKNYYRALADHYRTLAHERSEARTEECSLPIPEPKRKRKSKSSSQSDRRSSSSMGKVQDVLSEGWAYPQALSLASSSPAYPTLQPSFPSSAYPAQASTTQFPSHNIDFENEPFRLEELERSMFENGLTMQQQGSFVSEVAQQTLPSVRPIVSNPPMGENPHNLWRNVGVLACERPEQYSIPYDTVAAQQSSAQTLAPSYVGPTQAPATIVTLPPEGFSGWNDVCAPLESGFVNFSVVTSDRSATMEAHSQWMPHAWQDPFAQPQLLNHPPHTYADLSASTVSPLGSTTATSIQSPDMISFMFSNDPTFTSSYSHDALSLSGNAQLPIPPNLRDVDMSGLSAVPPPTRPHVLPMAVAPGPPAPVPSDLGSGLFTSDAAVVSSSPSQPMQYPSQGPQCSSAVLHPPAEEPPTAQEAISTDMSWLQDLLFEAQTLLAMPPT
ncbi:hypothetical protein BD414DRAFT_61501 [Trametes punicea]|nr:hypothetical protein BD414DRAFT_61501 [Trametes punicea]